VNLAIFVKKLANCFAKLPSVMDGYDWKDMASYGKKGQFFVYDQVKFFVYTVKYVMVGGLAKTGSQFLWMVL
jgi:hypothetical protein